MWIILVAPRAGAWIETEKWFDQEFKKEVAPRAGAWIETKWMGDRWEIIPVAPRAGAWIETSVIKIVSVTVSSLPVRERGLKLLESFALFHPVQSLPVRERGLKL